MMSNSEKKKSTKKADVDEEDVEVKNQYRKMFEQNKNEGSEKIEHVKDVAKEKLEEIFKKDN